MGHRLIEWACSRCGASFTTREALTAHAATDHEGHPSENTTGQDLAKPVVSANEAELPPNELRQRDAGVARRSESDALTNPPGQEPSAASTDLDQRGEPTESTRSHDLVKPSVSAIASEPSSTEPWRPDKGSARQSVQSAAAPGAKPTAAPTPRPHRGSPNLALRTLGWAAVAAICIAAMSLGIAFHHQIAHQIALAITRQPTPFTQLYFSDPNALPKSLSLSHPNRFGFKVVNHEGRDTAYSYVVTLASSTGSSTIAQGRIDLRSNEGATRLVDVRPTRRATEYLITVNLVGRTEMIRFRGVSQ